jgi:hypothetical protein
MLRQLKSLVLLLLLLLGGVLGACGSERGDRAAGAEEASDDIPTPEGISREDTEDRPPEAVMLVFPDTSGSWEAEDEKGLIRSWVSDLVLPAAADGGMRVTASLLTGATVDDYAPFVTYSFGWTGDANLRQQDLAAVKPDFIELLDRGLDVEAAERTDMLGVLRTAHRLRSSLTDGTPMYVVVIGDGVTNSEGCNLHLEYETGDGRGYDEMATVCADLLDGIDLTGITVTVLGGGRTASGELPETVTTAAEPVLRGVVTRLGGCLSWVFDPDLTGDPAMLTQACS